MFGRERPKPGESPDTAFQLPAANSLEGIKKEYDTLSQLFGRRDRDWKLVARSQVAHNGRTLEKFDVSHKGKRRTVYFDITEWLSGNPDAQFSPAALLVDQTLSDFMVEVSVRADVATLFPVSLLKLTDDQLDQLHFPRADRAAVIEAFMESAVAASKLVERGPPYANVPVLLSAKRWVLVSHFVRSINTDNPLLEDIVEELRFAIDGGLKAAIRKLQRD